MSQDGKLCDVLVDEFILGDEFIYLEVWADANMENVIKSVPGVVNVYNITSEVEYHVFLDPRYDREWVKAEIEAQIKINMKSL